MGVAAEREVAARAGRDQAKKSRLRRAFLRESGFVPYLGRTKAFTFEGYGLVLAIYSAHRVALWLTLDQSFPRRLPNFLFFILQ